jgi:hypothetical protein
MMPSVSFDKKEDGDPATYEDYSTFIGSIFCGGNVGSMTKSGLTTMEFNRKLVVFDKVVGGCNNAYVAAKSGVNAEYNGGIIGAPSERAEGAYIEKVGSDNKEYIKNRLVMNFNGLFDSKKRVRLFKDNDVQILVPYGRMKFVHRDKGFLNSPNFQSVYVCNKLLKKQIEFSDFVF